MLGALADKEGPPLMITPSPCPFFCSLPALSISFPISSSSTYLFSPSAQLASIQRTPPALSLSLSPCLSVCTLALVGDSLKKQRKRWALFRFFQSTMSRGVAEDAELELGLGLGLSIGGGGCGGRTKHGGSREYGRILTAQDFPSLVSKTPVNGNNLASVSGTKRAAAEPASQEGGGGSPTSVRSDLPFYLLLLTDQTTYPKKKKKSDDRLMVVHV